MINAYADIAGNTGYCYHARHFFRALNKLSPVCLIPKNGGLPATLDDDLMDMLSRLGDFDVMVPSINLDFLGVDLCRFAGKPRIGFVVFEGTLINPIYARILKQLDRVWVPTSWGKTILEQNGIGSHKIDVVPEGVDTTVFKPGLEPYPQIAATDAWRFLAVGKWENRKGIVELLSAFDRAFDERDNVQLVVHFVSNVVALAHVNVEEEINKLKLKNRRKIVVIRDTLATDADMARLYNSCDAFVSAAKAEGWGLPIVEAMACGLPVIAPFYSGPTAYLSEKNSFPLTVSEFEDVSCPVFFPDKGQYGQWAKINIDALSGLMRRVYENRDEAKSVGKYALEDIQTKWTWDLAAKKAVEILKLNC